MDVNEAIIMLLMEAVGVGVVAFLRHWHAYHLHRDRLSRSLRFHVRAELAVQPAARPRKKWMPPQEAFGQRRVG
jgi:hypothetical protein